MMDIQIHFLSESVEHLKVKKDELLEDKLNSESRREDLQKEVHA